MGKSDFDNNYISFENCEIQLTDHGKDKLFQLCSKIHLHDDIEHHINPLIEIKYYSSAVRDACILIEDKLRYIHKNKLFGMSLIDFHVKELSKFHDLKWWEFLTVYRNDLRTLFKYFRNEFSHNIRSLIDIEFFVIVNRINRIYLTLIDIEKILNKD